MKSTKTKAIEKIRAKYDCLRSCLNERSRRIWAATEARGYGYGGIQVVYAATGITYKTVKRGLKELEDSVSLKVNQVRNTGGGRRKQTEKDPSLLEDIKNWIEPLTRGDPESPLLWISKSTYNLAKALQEKGHKICQRSVCTRLSELGFSLQSNKKTKEGNNHEDRDAQFLYINKKIKKFQKESFPVISVDTKKKENIGNFKNEGQEYSLKGNPVEVNGHDFPDKELGKVAPYGVYDITHNKGWVNVGISADTAEFAVESIRSWWEEMGKKEFSKFQKLLVTADCGGSNGNRVKLWKIKLQELANELGTEIHVSHLPPGTSKWNKIEHKMFSFITKNWRGRPLLDRATVVNLIRETKTKSGLIIKARIDQKIYQKGVKVSEEELNSINMEKEDFHGEWNYVIHPQN